MDLGVLEEAALLNRRHATDSQVMPASEVASFAVAFMNS